MSDESLMSLDLFIDWFKSDLDRFRRHVVSQPGLDIDDEPLTWEEWEDEFDKFVRAKQE